MLSVMTRDELQAKIERIKGEIAALGLLRPGSIYERENVCGRPGCQCGRKKNPIKHGPYHYLSYTFEGKSHTEFVRQGQLTRTREQIRNYEKRMRLVKELVQVSIQLARLLKDES